MPRFSISWLIVPAAVAAVAAVLLADPGPGGATDADMEAAGRDLDARQQVVAARVAYKEGLIDRLVAGQVTLVEVTTEFLRLNQDTPLQEVIRLRYPGSGDEEKTARNVLAFVAARRLPADQKTRVTARLEGEFRRRFGFPPAEVH